MVDLWKICNELQLITPSDASSEKVSVREFVNKFCGQYLRSTEDNLRCELASYGVRVTSNSQAAKTG